MDAQIINISLPGKLLALVDKVAEKEARSRSELFREAIRSYVFRRAKWDELFSYARKQAKKLKIKEADVDSIVRKYRAKGSI
jgi:metal-responsive CopG/Arc/MetJ family transcriptional regulator